MSRWRHHAASTHNTIHITRFSGLTVYPVHPTASARFRRALDLLTRWPTLAAVQAACTTTLRQFYYRHHSRWPDVVEERLAVVATARPLTTDDALIVTSVLQVQRSSRCCARSSAIDRFDEVIAAAFAAHPDAELFAHLPGAGPALAPRLLVSFGADRTRYPDAASLQKYSGVAPVREKRGRQM